MNTYYFTFGSSELYPYRYGWVEIQAPNERTARDVYRLYYPDKVGGFLNCAFVYGSEFEKTAMYRGEYGDKCHARIRFEEVG